MNIEIPHVLTANKYISVTNKLHWGGVWGWGAAYKRGSVQWAAGVAVCTGGGEAVQKFSGRKNDGDWPKKGCWGWRGGEEGGVKGGTGATMGVPRGVPVPGPGGGSQAQPHRSGLTRSVRSAVPKTGDSPQPQPPAVPGLHPGARAPKRGDVPDRRPHGSDIPGLGSPPPPKTAVTVPGCAPGGGRGARRGTRCPNGVAPRRTRCP